MIAFESLRWPRRADPRRETKPGCRILLRAIPILVVADLLSAFYGVCWLLPQSAANFRFVHLSAMPPFSEFLIRFVDSVRGCPIAYLVLAVAAWKLYRLSVGSRFSAPLLCTYTVILGMLLVLSLYGTLLPIAMTAHGPYPIAFH